MDEFLMPEKVMISMLNILQRHFIYSGYFLVCQIFFDRLQNQFLKIFSMTLELLTHFAEYSYQKNEKIYYIYFFKIDYLVCIYQG